MSPARTILNAEAVAGYAYGAKFRGEALAIAVAVAKAESSFNPAAVGDVDLSQKGERSVGLWQVNYRPTRDKLGGIRDPNLNLDPAHNARAAWEISSGGTRWSPWSVYTSGAYKRHLDEARTAARTVEQRGGTANSPDLAPSAGGTSTTTSTAVTYGPTTADVLKPIPPPSVGLVPGRPLTVGPESKMMGKRVVDIVGERLIEHRVDLAHDAVPELVFGVIPPPGINNAVLEHFTDGAQVDYGDLRVLIAAVEVGPDPAGAHIAVTVTARSFGMQRLRKSKRGPWSNMSPTQVVETMANLNGMGFVAKGSPTRSTISRQDGEKEGDEESDLDLAERLAKELGYVLFDGGQVLYFGPPSWLLSKGVEVRAEWNYRLGYDVLGIPTIRRTTDDEDRRRTITLALPYERGRRVRPGHKLAHHGIAAFHGDYLVTSVRWNELDPSEPVEIEAIIPIDPEPEPPKESTFAASATSTPTPASSTNGAGANLGRASALDFVSVALAQVGDTYIYGAEVKLDDPDPTAFDCSELVQWACARVGISFVDGSSAQIAKCKKIPVAEALRIRGALLHKPGHIGISLGDGGGVVEALGRKYGVRTGKSMVTWTDGGLIPGMNYTNGQA